MSEQPQPETVPKAEFEQVKSKAEEATRTMETLKNQLLDPEYLSYLESKRAPRAAAPSAPMQTVNMANMTLEQLQTMIRDGVANTVQEALKPFNTRLSDVMVKQELADAMKKFPDFDEYRGKITEVFQTSQNELTIEQAYHLAKSQSSMEAPKTETPKAKAPASNEKPSASVPVDGETMKAFKTPEAAGNAAWNEVASKYGLSGDSI